MESGVLGGVPESSKLDRIHRGRYELYMPIYEFYCNACENEFEELLSAREAEKGATCPRCGDAKPRKLISGFATSSAGKSSSGGAAACPPGGRFT